MRILTSKARAKGGSVSTTIPVEAARRMGVNPGDELYWVEDGLGGYHVAVATPQRAALMRAHADVADEYRSVFAALSSDTGRRAGEGS